MACIIRNKQGEVEQVISDNGTPSSLFEALREETGELAEELYQATTTPLFKETVIKPKVVRHLRRVREVLNPSRAVKIGISRPVNVQQLIVEGEVSYTNEEGQLCASEGLAGAGFTLGAAWVLAEDLAGEPSHRLGGVDLQFGEDGISYKNSKGEDIKAEDGLLIPEFSEHEWEEYESENEWEIYDTENEWQEHETNNEWIQASENIWEVVEDLAGEPSHEEGGVDIQISEEGVTFDDNKGVDVEAQEGLNIEVDPKVPMHQDGGRIRIKDDKVPTVTFGTPEYDQAYREGRFADRANRMDEVNLGVVDATTGKQIQEDYPYYDRLSDEEKKYFRDTSTIGSQIRSRAKDGRGFDAGRAEEFVGSWMKDLPLASMQASQSALVEGIEAVRGNEYDFLDAVTPGEQRTPSDTFLKDSHPAVQFAGDMAIDPGLLAGVGSGIANRGKRLATRAAKRTTGIDEGLKAFGKEMNQQAPVPRFIKVQEFQDKLNSKYREIADIPKLAGRPEYKQGDLIHRSTEFLDFKDGKLVWSPKGDRYTHHFTTNKPVTDHGGGAWSSASETLITPYDVLVNKNKLTPINIEPSDTYFGSTKDFIAGTPDSKVFTTSKENYLKYKGRGISVEYAGDEADAIRKKIINLHKKQDELLKQNRGLPPGTEEYRKIAGELEEANSRHAKIHEDWVKKNRKKMDYTELEKQTGLKSYVDPETGEYHSASAHHSNSYLSLIERKELDEAVNNVKKYAEYVTKGDEQMLELLYERTKDPSIKKILEERVYGNK